MLTRYRHRKAIKNVYRPLMQELRLWSAIFNPTHEDRRRAKYELLYDHQKLRDLGCEHTPAKVRALRGN